MERSGRCFLPIATGAPVRPRRASPSLHSWLHRASRPRGACSCSPTATTISMTSIFAWWQLILVTPAKAPRPEPWTSDLGPSRYMNCRTRNRRHMGPSRGTWNEPSRREGAVFRRYRLLGWLPHGERGGSWAPVRSRSPAPRPRLCHATGLPGPDLGNGSRPVPCARSRSHHRFAHYILARTRHGARPFEPRRAKCSTRRPAA